MADGEINDPDEREIDGASDQRDVDVQVNSEGGLEDSGAPKEHDESLHVSDASIRSEGCDSSDTKLHFSSLDSVSGESSSHGGSGNDDSFINPFDTQVLSQQDVPGSVSILISKVKEGDEESVRELWNRYSGALVRSAQSRMNKQVAAKVDSEDLAQSVFFAIYRGAVEDKFDQLNDRAGFWTLVLAITRRKAVDRIRKLTAAKRGGEAALRASQGSLGDSGDNLVDRAPSREVDPQVEVECNDLLKALTEQLDAEDASGMLTNVAMSRIAGLSVKEIASELERTERTVERKLSLIRSLWSESMPGL